MSKNDITGDSLRTKPSTDKFRDNWETIFGKKDMIRKHPRNDLDNPPGQIVNRPPQVANPVQQEKPLPAAIAVYKEEEIYKQGFLDGYEKGRQSVKVLDLGSEASR